MTYYIECKEQTNAAELECLINSGEKYKATQEDCLIKLEKIESMRKLESEYERGMREAMKDIAKSCGKTFLVDIGYLELPKLVDELVNKDKPKPRTKVVYELCNFNSRSEAIKYYEDIGELFISANPHAEYYNINDCDGEWWSVICRNWENLYKEVEKEIDWKDELSFFFR